MHSQETLGANDWRLTGSMMPIVAVGTTYFVDHGVTKAFHLCYHAIRLKAIALRLEAIGSRLKAIALRVEGGGHC